MGRPVLWRERVVLKRQCTRCRLVWEVAVPASPEDEPERSLAVSGPWKPKPAERITEKRSWRFEQ